MGWVTGMLTVTLQNDSTVIVYTTFFLLDLFPSVVLKKTGKEKSSLDSFLSLIIELLNKLLNDEVACS